MEKLRAPRAETGSRALQPAYANASMPTPNFRTGVNLPRITDRIADLEIPRNAWSNWIPDFGERMLRRALRQDERAALEHRRDELAPAVVPYQDRDTDRVALALAEMFGSIPSMRHTGDEMVARVDGARRVLRPFPAWAIEKACATIQAKGVFRDGRYEKQWPPSDAEIADVVRDELRLYGDAYGSAVALLAAKVEA
jgi:hypothetical protein